MCDNRQLVQEGKILKADKFKEPEEKLNITI